MPGHGPAPKLPEQRSGRAVPTRGEWQDLPPLTKPLLPCLPRRSKDEGPWSHRTRQAWESWRADWATGIYGKAEIGQAVHVAYLFEDAVRSHRMPSMWAEVRQWLDRLGLTMKGKRDLRLRLADTTAAKPAQRTAKKSRLRLVNDAVVSK